MAAGREARLVIRLIDRFSKQSRQIVKSVNSIHTAMSSVGRATVAMSRNLGHASRRLRRAMNDATALSAGVTLALGDASRKIYDLEDTLNEVVGRRFGKQAMITLADGTKMTKEAFRQSVRDLITTIDKDAPRTAGQIAKAYNQLVQAGLSHEQVQSILPTAVNFSIASNYETEAAADRLTNIMTAMRVPMVTMGQAEESAKRVSDVLAYAANITNSSVQQMTESFKFAAPAAASLGIDVEQLASMFVVMARSGIKASEAGVAIRSMLVRMIRPTKMGLAAMQRAGLDPRDYIDSAQDVTGADIETALKLGGISIKGGVSGVDEILKSGLGLADQVQQITDIVAKRVSGSAVDKGVISDLITETLFGRGEGLDIENLIADLQKAKIPVADFFRIFDVRQGARIQTILGADLSGVVEQIRKNAEGFSKALSTERMNGFVGSVQRLNSALTRLYISLAESGVLDSVTNALTALVDVLDRIGETNPQILEFGTYAAMALAAAAPLGFILSGLGAIVGALGVAFGALITPLGAAVAGLAYIAYLNFDSITAFLKGFGQGVSENFGPRTVALFDAVIAKFEELTNASRWTMADAGKARDGYTWGKWVSESLEAGIVAVENAIARYRRLKEQSRQLGKDIRAGFLDSMDWLINDSDKWIGSQVAKIPDIVSKMLDRLMSSELVTKFSQAGAAIAQGIEGVAKRLYDAGANMIQSLWDGAKSKFEELLTWLRELPSRIMSAIGNIDLSSAFSFGSLFGSSSTGGPGHTPIAQGVGSVGVPQSGGNTSIRNEGAHVVFHNSFKVEGGETAAVEKMAKYLEGQLSRSAEVSFSGPKNFGDY